VCVRFIDMQVNNSVLYVGLLAMFASAYLQRKIQMCLVRTFLNQWLRNKM